MKTVYIEDIKPIIDSLRAELKIVLEKHQSMIDLDKSDFRLEIQTNKETDDIEINTIKNYETVNLVYRNSQ